MSSTTNCPCDEIIFPPPLVIAAGLSELPLQFATFPEFRAVMLDAITRQPALSHWRARSSDDFGVMLVEMWSYVCDSIAFYREIIGNEQYDRTASLRPSLRKLIGLLGYVPRPASSASVDLVALADGRQPVVLPAGTAFRSGAFPGGTPQVFELDLPTKIQSLLNQWHLARFRPKVIDEDKGASLFDYESSLAQPGTVTVKTGAVLLVRLTDNSVLAPANVISVVDTTGTDGLKYKQVHWTPSVVLAGSTPLAKIELLRPTQHAGLWKQAVQSGDGSVIWGNTVVLDGLYRGIAAGSLIVLQLGSELRWFRCNTAEVMRKLPKSDAVTYTDPVTNKQTTVSPPYPLMAVTVLALDVDINNPTRRGSSVFWSYSDAGNIVAHYGFVSAAVPTVPFSTTLDDGQAIDVPTPIESPADGSRSNAFLLEDKNGLGAELDATLDYSTGTVTPGQSATIGETLVFPITMYGNIVTASRGETVPSELLGVGEATLENPSFTLKKKPLTYVPSPTAGNETGVVSTLTIWAGGLLWAETLSFFGHSVDDPVYIVRENDDGEAVITFNGRLPTGVPIVASYRFGAGATSPPAGSISQVAKAVKGMKSVRNPVAASGGADAEGAANLATNAPKSALLLGRAVSMDDMQAAAANVAGVRAVQAQWRWNDMRQRPVVQIWYVGAASVRSKVLQTLRGLSDPTTPLSVDEALPVVANLSISLETDPRRNTTDVAKAVKAALLDPAYGLLAPERIGIGATLFRSHIFESVLAITGAIAVDGLLLNGAPFEPYGVNPGAGKYFDFAGGLVSINSRADTYVTVS